GTLSGAAPNLLNDWQSSGRLDHRFNDKHNVGGRYLYDTRETVSGQAVPPGLTGQSPEKRQALGTFFNSTFSPNVFNELRASYQRYTTKTFAADTVSENIPSIEVTELGLSGFNAAASRTAIGLAVNFPQGAGYNTYQLSNTLGWIRGSHSMKFGVDFRRIEQATEFNPTLRGRIQYTTLQNMINDIAQAAAINTLQPGVPRIQPYRYYDYFFFAQDEWHLKPRLTLTYGLRYETPGNAADTLVKLVAPILARNNNNPAYGFVGPKRDTNNWAPRIGLNYRFGQGPGPLDILTGNARMVMRMGYSRTYDGTFNNILLNVFSAFPFTIVTTRPANAPNAFATIDPIRAGTVIPAVANPLLVTRTSVANDFRSPYSEQFTFNVQRELATDWAFTLGWVATKGTGLFQSIDGN
ncbi:MAG: TonB-dependent receptor domain-containing protein, partial [Longimicrobiales bacterium]